VGSNIIFYTREEAQKDQIQNNFILEGHEDHEGEFRCAGCGTPLFANSSKVHSGT